jgi:glutamate racemase
LIGVFDSGVGGLSILKALRRELPAHDFTYFADTGYAPYGGQGDAYIIDRSRAVARTLVNEHRAQALVIACNTATAAAVHVLRRDYPQLPIVGVEPALKPAAALTRTGRVGVMATRFTVGSAKFLALLDTLKGQAEFVLQPCDGLVDAIEAHDGARIAQQCAQYTLAMGSFGTAPGSIDTLVLGCTHYIFAREVLVPLVGPGVTILETGEPVARQTRRILESAGLLRSEGAGQVKFLTTGSAGALQEAAQRWLAPGWTGVMPQPSAPELEDLKPGDEDVPPAPGWTGVMPQPSAPELANLKPGDEDVIGVQSTLRCWTMPSRGWECIKRN